MRGKDMKICDVEDGGMLSSLTGEARVRCARCGATSNEKANLCEPVSFEPGR